MAFGWAAIASLAAQGVNTYLDVSNERAKRKLENDEADRQDSYYSMKENENPLVRSDDKELLSEYNRQSERQLERAENVGKIMGATPEFGLAVQGEIANGRANLLGDIASGESQRRDYFSRLRELARQKKAENEMARLNANTTKYANLAANAASTFGAMMDSYSASKVNAQKTPVGDSGAVGKKMSGIAVSGGAIDDNVRRAAGGVFDEKYRSGWSAAD